MEACQQIVIFAKLKLRLYLTFTFQNNLLILSNAMHAKTLTQGDANAADASWPRMYTNTYLKGVLTTFCN